MITSFKFFYIKKMNLPEFDDLIPSTKTITIYCNVKFNRKKIFKEIPIQDYNIEYDLTKKKKNIDKKKVKAPYGSIVRVSNGIYFRGMKFSSKKYFCPVCQVVRVKGNIEKKVLTIEEEVDENYESNNDIKRIKFKCRNCEQYYEPSNFRKIVYFLNQTPIVISLGTKLFNVMMFDNTLCISGCKKIEDAMEVVMVLWEEYILKIPGSYQLNNDEVYHQPLFIFTEVMTNVKYNLGFYVDREKINSLMNRTEYSDRIYMSQFEATGHTGVNVKMFSNLPENMRYRALIYEDDHFENVYVKENVYDKKSNKKRYNTFIVFSSSEIILSGKYYESMKESYNFFNNIIKENKDYIKEVIVEPQHDLMTFLKMNSCI